MHSAEKVAPELFAKRPSLAAALTPSICKGWGPLIRAGGDMIKRLVVQAFPVRREPYRVPVFGHVV